MTSFSDDDIETRGEYQGASIQSDMDDQDGTDTAADDADSTDADTDSTDADTDSTDADTDSTDPS
jgi:hypothetical protein